MPQTKKTFHVTVEYPEVLDALVADGKITSAELIVLLLSGNNENVEISTAEKETKSVQIDSTEGS